MDVEGEAVLEAEEEVEVRHRRRELGDNEDCFLNVPDSLLLARF